MIMDLDTEDRINRYRSAMSAIMQLLDGQDQLSLIKPHEFGVLLHLLHEEHERALPCGGRPPRAHNDLDD